MKNIMKKLALLGICVALVVGGVSPLAIQAEASESVELEQAEKDANPTAGQCGDNAYWTYDTTSKELKITGKGEMYDYAETDNGTTEPWSQYATKVKKITISKNITRIGDNTFVAFRKITAVTLPKNLTSIGAFAFTSNDKLKTLVIPDKVKTVGDWTFSSSGFKNLTIGKNVTKIGENAFAFTNLYKGKITIKSQKIKTIGRGAFYNLGKTQKIAVPSSKLKAYKKLIKKATDSKYKGYKAMTENKNAEKKLLYTYFDYSTF